MRRKIRVKELCTPCAGLRPGAADPMRSKAAFPPPRQERYFERMKIKVLRSGRGPGDVRERSRGGLPRFLVVFWRFWKVSGGYGRV